MRPRIALLGRYTSSAAALRYAGVVSARALLQSVWDAGGDPVTLLPAEPSDWDERLAGFSGVLLVGGGDINPRRYGQEPHESVYDVDDVQDAADLSLAGFALERGIPTLAVCRGLHLVNVLRGGTLVQDMPVNHRHTTHDVQFRGATYACSCYHHQAVDTLGAGLQVAARAADGTVEALTADSPGWFTGVQWHPEDTAASDPMQAALFAELVTESRTHARACVGTASRRP